MHSLFTHGQLPLFGGHSKMKLTLQLIFLWLLLTKGKASEKRSHRKTVFSRTPSQGWVSNRTQQTLSVKPKASEKSDTLTLGSVSSSHSAGHHGSVDQDQRAGLNRRVMQNRRGQQMRTTANQGSVSQEPGVANPERKRTLSPPSRTATGSAGSLNILASFAGKNRILVISSPHESDGYYRLMMSLLKSDVYCEMAERHMQQIILFHQENKAGGKVRRVSNQGQVTEEPLDPALVPRLMSFLKLEEGKFSMVLVRKNLQVEERYPYPVRLEAVYEVMDQTPIRKLEKARQRGFVQRCKAAGVEGQVVTMDTDGQQNATLRKTPAKETTMVRAVNTPIQMPVVTIIPVTTPTMRTTTKSTTTTTRRPRRTTTKAITTTKRTLPTTTTKPPTTTVVTTTTTRSTTTTMPSTTASLTTPAPAKLQTDPWDIDPLATNEDNVFHTTNREGDENQRITDTSSREMTPGQTEVTETTLDEGEEESGGDHSRGGKIVVDSDVELISMTSKKGRKPTEGQQRRKHPNKPNRKNKADKKRAKPSKEGSTNLRGRKSGKKGVLYQEKHDGDRSAAKRPKAVSPLASFFGSFERRRRLLVITTPSEENRMYTQQRDEYLENVCEMAVRKLSIITIFGSWDNGTMKIDHYQLEQDQALKGVPRDDLTNQVLIKALREELGMMFNDYYMVLTDFDMKAKQEYEVPIAMKAVLDYIDTFSSRITEMEEQKTQGVTCKKEDKSRSLENFLSRFRWRRRLFIISAPDDEEWAYQQQLYSLTSQACNLGLRHMSVLKLVGKDMDFMGGVLELYPINGSSTVEREDLSAMLVRDIRNYFQISPEYFSMLLVGKDGNVKSWYPSPMWSMSIIYDLVDSMQLRRQEMAIQQSLGMRCPNDEYSHHGYHEQDPDGYGHRGYGY